MVDHFINQRRRQAPQEPNQLEATTSPRTNRATKDQGEFLLGRSFHPQITAMTPEEEGFEGGQPYVMFITPSPLALYKMTADQALRLAARLTAAAEAVKQSQTNEK